MKQINSDDICVQCGETRGRIKKRKLYCCLVNSSEDGEEVDCEWDRHRYKPYSKKELDAMQRDEDEKYRQMGDMADFFNKQENLIK